MLSILYPVQGVLTSNFSSAEVAAFSGLEERRVRKDLEFGFFATSNPPRFDFAALVYFTTIAGLSFTLGVADRRSLHQQILAALACESIPVCIALGSFADLRLAAIAETVEAKLQRFTAWKNSLAEDEAILGGELVFPKSRLSVRRIGCLLLRGETPEELMEDYPYITYQDLVFAQMYVTAYPRQGRPREDSP
jgi:uncharacterized protein (DUF433 family)